MTACKHLDFDESAYPQCELVTIEGMDVKHWRRKNVPYKGAPVNVQFCGQGRGRINGIFQCYNPGEMPCYEPADQPAGKEGG